MNLSIDETPISQDSALREVREIVETRFRDKNIRVYEAGGGSFACLSLSAFNNPSITVVDIDETQLRNNSYSNNKILGDIQTYSFPPSSFDLVICYNVIEHLARPDQAITRFYDALEPGGLLFIAAPNPESLSGIVARLTPHWFHVWFHRLVFRNKNAGKPGQHPFPTVFHRTVFPKALRNFCEKLGFEVIYFKVYMGAHYSNIRKTRPIIGQALHSATNLMNAFMFGRRDLRLGDYYVVLQKSSATAKH